MKKVKGVIGGTLLGWYDRNRRKLPWREEVSPYRTWVSEIMLQQTQVATVVPYFEKFLHRFPDIPALAAADQEDVLKYWAGLGYYSRARNLHSAAREVMAQYGGRLPDTPEGLMDLPGIGRYTAGAIASIAFGKPSPLVDGNVIRVFARLFGLRGEAKSPALQRKIWELAEEHLDASRPGDWNQALMELGARVCLPAPEAPRCGECPLASQCQARAQGVAHLLPESGPQKEPVSLRWTALYVERGGNVLLWRRSASERFLRGLWGLPEKRHLKGARAGRRLRTVRHTITYHRIQLDVVQAALKSEALPPQASWKPRAELGDYLVSSLWRKALAL